MIQVQFPSLLPWQAPVFSAVTSDNGEGNLYLIKARRQCGKSVLCEAILLFFALSRDNSIGFCLEPTLKQCRRVWKQIVKAVGGESSPVLKSCNQTLLTIEFINGSEITFGSAEQGDALRGATVKKSVLIIDEAAFVDDETIQVLQPLVDVSNAPVMYVSTPLFMDGRFYETYVRGINGDPRVKVFDWALEDTSQLLSNEKLEYYRSTMSPLKFQSEYLAQFISDKSFVFGDIFACVGPYSTKPSVFAGVDWSAGVDGDYTVIVYLDEDGGVTDIKYWKDFDSVALVDELAADIQAHRDVRKVKVEMNSIGKIYHDLLKRKLRPGLLQQFTTTNESKREIVEELISAFQTGRIRIPNLGELIKELQHFAATKTPGGKLTYEASENYHDDFVMALAIAWSCLAKKTDGKIRIRLV